MNNNLELRVVFAAADKFSRSAKAMNVTSGKLSKAFKEARESLKKLEDQGKLIESFRSTNKALGITKNDLKAARDRVAQMAKAMEAAGVPSEKMQKAFKHASQEARNLAAHVNRLTEKKQRLRSELAAVNIDTKKLSDSQRALKDQIAEATKKVTEQDGALHAHNKKMQKMRGLRADIDQARQRGEKMRSTGVGLAATGAAINAAGAVPVMAYAKAEDSITQLKVAMMQKDGSVAEEFKAVSDLAMKLGTKLPGTAADYQDMMTMLIRQGMPAKNILGGLGEAAAYLAVQLKMAPAEAAEFASKMQDATRATDKEMMGLMDTIQRTFYVGVEQNSMLNAFSKLAPALSIIKKDGLDAAKVLAPLLAMADQSSLKGEAAGNAFRKVFQMSLDKVKVGKGNAELSGTGIKLDFTNGKGEFGGLEKMYAQLEKLRGVNSQKRLAALKKIFGDDAETLQALTIMMEKGAAGYADMQAKMEKQADLQRRVNEQLGTLKAAWDTAAGTFETAMVRFGESIAPDLKSAADWTVKLTEGLDNWAKENPALAGTLMTVVKWTGMAAVALGAIFIGLSALATPLAVIKYAFGGLGVASRAIGILGSSVGFLKTVILAIGRVLLANPIGLLIAGIATAAYLIYEYWGPIKEFFGNLWSGITTAAKLAWSELTAWFSGLKETFSTIGTNIAEGFWNGLSSAWAWVQEKAAGLVGMLPETVRKVLGIHSPSRVFAEIGMHTMAGLEKGMDDNQDGPLSSVGNVVKKMAALGAGVVVGAAPLSAAAGAGGAGNTYQITINAPAGTDNAGLATLVAREIERIEASKAARSRSQLRDME